MKFSEWLPDQDSFENPGLTEATNVLPASFYKPIRSLISQSSALSGPCIGAFSTKDSNGTSINIAGSETKLYTMQNGIWNDISRVGGYNTNGENKWAFIRFGDNILATNRSDDVQILNLSNSNFADLSGNPPKAKHIAVVRDFVVLGNIDTGASNEGANQVHWSGLNDVTEWTPGNNESDFQIFPEGGPITGMVGGEFGLIFQENQITRMEYQGPPLNFSFDVIETGIGALSSGSIVRIGIQTFYLSNNGFYMTDGNQSYPIGSEKVDKYFFSNLDENELHKISSAIDPINKMVIWSYVSKNSSLGIPDKLIIYNWDLKRWTEAHIETNEHSLKHQLVYTSLSEDYTLSSLDAFGTLNEIGTALDSRFWLGGSLILSAFSVDNKLSTFSGTVLPAAIKTGEFEINELEQSLITQIWPEIDGDIKIEINSRDSHQDDERSTSLVKVNSIGFAPFTEYGRYHSIEFNFENWSRASGFKIKSEAIGEY